VEEIDDSEFIPENPPIGERTSRLVLQLRDESKITIDEARDYCQELFAASGRRITKWTLYSWIRNGLKYGGSIVKLEAFRCGKYLVTTRQAVERFHIRNTEIQNRRQRKSPSPPKTVKRKPNRK
jgi:hypothetical protein